MSRAPRAPRVRRTRGAQESLGSIVLGVESIIVFLGGLVVYGLRALPDGIEPWWGIVGGSILAVLLLVTSGLQRYQWGVALGWFWQLIIVASAVLEPAFALVALIFGALWAYATIKGASLDRRNARLAAEAEQRNGD